MISKIQNIVQAGKERAPIQEALADQQRHIGGEILALTLLVLVDKQLPIV